MRTYDDTFSGNKIYPGKVSKYPPLPTNTPHIPPHFEEIQASLETASALDTEQNELTE